MSMPKLDPLRYIAVVLTDPAHRLPMYDKPGRYFSQDPRAPDLIDIFDPYYASLLAGGSIRRACVVAHAPVPVETAVEPTPTPPSEPAPAPEPAVIPVSPDAPSDVTPTPSPEPTEPHPAA